MGIVTVKSEKPTICSNYKFVLLVQKCNLFGQFRCLVAMSDARLLSIDSCLVPPAYCLFSLNLHSYICPLIFAQAEPRYS